MKIYAPREKESARERERERGSEEPNTFPKQPALLLQMHIAH